MLFRKLHVVAVGIILIVVGAVAERVGDIIGLGAVGEALWVLIGRLDGFVIVRVYVRRSVIRMLIIRRVWRRVV